MAKSDDELKRIKIEIEDVQRRLGSKMGIDVMNLQNLEDAQKALKVLKAELRDMSSDLVYIRDSFKDAVNELSKQNEYLSKAKSALKGISSFASQILQHRRGENSLTVKELEKLQHKAALNKADLELAVKRGNLTATQRTAVLASIADSEIFTKELERTLSLEQKINKEIGLAGTGLAGLAKFMAQLGFTDLSKPFADAIDETKKAKRELADLDGNLRAEQESARQVELEAQKKIGVILKKTGKSEEQLLASRKSKNREEYKYQLALKQFGEEEQQRVVKTRKALELKTSKYVNIVTQIGKQLTLTNLLDFAITKIVQGFLNVNKASVEFQRLTGQNAVAVGSMNTRFATTVDFLKTASELTQQIGLNAVSIFGPDQLAALAEAKNLLGLSAEEAGNLALQSKLSANTVDSFQDNMLAAVDATNRLKKSAVAPGVVLKDVLNTSKSISLSLGNNPEKLGKAATAARAFGMELKQVDSIANSLLNFESSIEAELEAQLLTGKNINLAKARELAMTNDLEGLSVELAKNGATAAEFANMNRFAQEALAKAVGMSRDDLAKSIMLQESSKNLSEEQRAAVLGIRKEQLQQVDIQERLNKSIDKLAQAFAPVLDLLVPVVDLMGTILNTATLITYPIQLMAEGIKILQAPLLIAAGLYGTILTYQQASLAVQKKEAVLRLLNMKRAAAMAALTALSNPVKAAIGIGAAALVAGVTSAYLSKAGDLNSPADGKTVVSTKEGGLFELSPNDDLIAAPGASAALQSTLSGGGVTTISIEPLIAEIQSMKQELKAVLTSIANREGKVYLDTDLVGKALVIGSTGI